jgi:hypothetical protein
MTVESGLRRVTNCAARSIKSFLDLTALIGESGKMAGRRRCSVCGKRATVGILERCGGLCWRCAHPGFWAACTFIAVVASVAVVAIVTHLKHR